MEYMNNQVIARYTVVAVSYPLHRRRNRGSRGGGGGGGGDRSPIKKNDNKAVRSVLLNATSYVRY